MKVLLNNGIAIVVSFYFLPLIIAHRRKSPDLVALALFNLFLGWSVVGWVAALLWARHINVRGLIARIIRNNRRNSVKSTLASIAARSEHRRPSQTGFRTEKDASNF